MSQNDQQYKMGDVANGHVLTEQGWVPLAAVPAQAPKKKSRKGLKITGGILGALFLIGILMPSEDSGTTAVADDTPAVSASEESSEEPVAGLGDPVRDGKFEVTIKDVETGLPAYGEGFLAEDAQGSFTVVTMKIENIGDEPQMFFADNQIGIDSKGRELAAESVLDDSLLEEINPGNSITANVVFDVAKGVDVDAVEVHDSAFSGGALISIR
jgi:hypothetical protein